MVVATQELKKAHAGTPGKVLIGFSSTDATALSQFEMIIGAFLFYLYR